MQACVVWVLIIFGTQVIKKKQPVRPVFPDYLSLSYDYDELKIQNSGAPLLLSSLLIFHDRFYVNHEILIAIVTRIVRI